jgi:hypothetical protein
MDTSGKNKIQSFHETACPDPSHWRQAKDYSQLLKTNVGLCLKEKATCSSKHILQCLQITFWEAR